MTNFHRKSITYTRQPGGYWASKTRLPDGSRLELCEYGLSKWFKIPWGVEKITVVLTDRPTRDAYKCFAAQCEAWGHMYFYMYDSVSMEYKETSLCPGDARFVQNLQLKWHKKPLYAWIEYDA